MRKTYHVTKTENGWQGKREDKAIPAVKGSTKSEVVRRTIEVAKEHQPSQVLIHKTDGRIQEERTYPRSSDPHTSRG